MNPTLRQMRAFVALAKTGNFTLAAQSLHVTQSALSGLIKELEQTLGTRVVDRNTRKIALTDIGRELYPLFSQMLDDLDGALTNIADHTRLKKGLVRIATPQLMACTVAPQVMAAYRDAHPGIGLQLADCEVDSVIARVLSGAADIGIGPERDVVPLLQARQLFEMPFSLVFPEGHPLETAPRVTWAQAARYPLIALEGQFTERLYAELQGSLSEMPAKPAFEVAFMSTALAMVGAGLGITVCLPYAEPLVKRYRLVMRQLEEPVMTRRFFVYTRAQRSLSPAAESFIEFLFRFVGQDGMATSALAATA